MGPYSNMTGVLIRRRNLDTDTGTVGRWLCEDRDTQGEGHVKTEAAMGAMHLSAREGCWPPLEARREAWRDPSSEPSEGTDPAHTVAHTVTSDRQSPELCGPAVAALGHARNPFPHLCCLTFPRSPRCAPTH